MYAPLRITLVRLCYDRRMSPLDELGDLVMIEREGSFTAAARALGVPRSTVSRRIARLEDAVGKRLIDRTTRSLRLTDAGRELVQRSRSPLRALSDALDAARQSDDVPRGPLRVAIPPGLGRGFWGEFIVGFQARHPDVQLIATHTTGRLHLLDDDYDVILQEDPPLSDTWISRVISPADRFLVATPAYLQAHGTPSRLESLSEHRCLAFVNRPAEQVDWPLRRGGSVVVRPTFCANDRSMVLDVCLADSGIALLSMITTSLDLLSGRLVPVLAADIGTSATLVALYAARSQTVPKVRALLQYIDEVVVRVGSGSS